MSRMFYLSTSFNQDIGNWDVSNVTQMVNMFNSASSFNQDISSWNVTNVSFFNSIFSGATNFNQDLSTWDFTLAINISSGLNDILGNASVNFCDLAKDDANVSSLLVRLSDLADANPNVPQSFVYSSGVTLTGPGSTALTNLNTTHSWTITTSAP